MQAGCIGLIQISVEFSTEYLGSLLFQFFASLNNCLGFLLLMMIFFYFFIEKEFSYTIFWLQYLFPSFSRCSPPPYLPSSTLFSQTHTHTKLKGKNLTKIKTGNHNIQTKNQYDKKISQAQQYETRNPQKYYWVQFCFGLWAWAYLECGSFT